MAVEGLSSSEVKNRYISNTINILEKAVHKVVLDDEKFTLLIDKDKLHDVLLKGMSGDVKHTLEGDSDVKDLGDYFEISTHIQFKSYAG